MKEIGIKIREARLEKGIEINEVADDTKIRKKYLLAIEEGEFDVIPQEVFLKGFLRVYANYVGLDGEKLVGKYNRLKALERKQLEMKTTDEQEELNPFVEDLIYLIKNNWTKILIRVLILIIVICSIFGVCRSNLLVIAAEKIRGLKEMQKEFLILIKGYLKLN